MTSALFHIFNGFLFILLVVVVTSATARPHFGDGNQDMEEQELGQEYPEFLDYPMDYESFKAKSDDWDQYPGGDSVLLRRLIEYADGPVVVRRGVQVKKPMMTTIRCHFNAITCFGK